ncbi:MAG: YihA family ribosome biogenesis GTP-binding protein [Gammaproteobacteria bacterium]|nr:YihA family ribosome biogenesis GTP-binding protein [Gammaproteobacteria bacterium]
MNKTYFAARFSTSANGLSQLPDDSLAEVAFAGRSNAGKSSAINAITRNGKLARTSKTPGRTQLINFFSLAEHRYLVDLPGYGYAKVSKQQQQHWQGILHDYLTQREQLRCLIMLMDSRHPLTDYDWQMIDLQQQGHAQLHVILTKADKLSKNAAHKTLYATQGALETAGIEATLQLFSATRPSGLEDAHSLLDMYLFPERTASQNQSQEPA